jgi:hypothetical protein
MVIDRIGPAGLHAAAERSRRERLTSRAQSRLQLAFATAHVQDDLYSLDAETLTTLKPVHALIFLFKYVGGDAAQTAAGVEVDPMDSGVWFANQVSWASLLLPPD